MKKYDVVVVGGGFAGVSAAIGAARENARVLLIEKGHIELPGFDYGFIGGASFVYEDKVIFFGNIERHPDFENIKDFIEATEYELIYNNSIPLTDIGGAVIL